MSEPCSIGAHSVSRNQCPGSDEVFSGLRDGSTGKGNSQAQQCHRAQSEYGTTIYCVLLLIVSGYRARAKKSAHGHVLSGC